MSERSTLLSASSSPYDDVDSSSLNDDAHLGNAYEQREQTTRTLGADVVKERANKRGISWFRGVFIPCSIAIFSPVFFLRLPLAVAQSGLLQVLLMLLVISVVLMMSGASTTIIVQNGRVREGGSYYMLSRTLGPELGGTMGVLLFFVHSLASAFSITGFAEMYYYLTSHEGNADLLALPFGETLIVTSIALVGVFLITLYGGRPFSLLGILFWAFKSIVIFFVIISLLFNTSQRVTPPPLPLNSSIPVTSAMFYTGPSATSLKSNAYATYHSTPNLATHSGNSLNNFMVIFGILLAAFTGVLSATNMSSELHKPRVSVPRGMAWACGTAILCYGLLAFIMSWTICCMHELSGSEVTLVTMRLAFNQFPVVAAVMAAAIGSAVVHLLAASQIILRMMRDFFAPAGEYCENDESVYDPDEDWLHRAVLHLDQNQTATGGMLYRTAVINRIAIGADKAGAGVSASHALAGNASASAMASVSAPKPLSASASTSSTRTPIAHLMPSTVAAIKEEESTSTGEEEFGSRERAASTGITTVSVINDGDETAVARKTATFAAQVDDRDAQEEKEEECNSEGSSSEDDGEYRGYDEVGPARPASPPPRSLFPGTSAWRAVLSPSVQVPIEPVIVHEEESLAAGYDLRGVEIGDSDGDDDSDSEVPPITSMQPLSSRSRAISVVSHLSSIGTDHHQVLPQVVASVAAAPALAPAVPSSPSLAVPASRQRTNNLWFRQRYYNSLNMQENTRTRTVFAEKHRDPNKPRQHQQLKQQNGEGEVEASALAAAASLAAASGAGASSAVSGLRKRAASVAPSAISDVSGDGDEHGDGSDTARGRVVCCRPTSQEQMKKQLRRIAQWIVRRMFTPVGCTTFSWIIVQIFLTIGRLDTLAPVVSMLFLLHTSLTNFAILLLKAIALPNFRPPRYYPFVFVFAGWFAPLVLMFMLKPLFALILVSAFLVTLILFSLLAPSVPWGDITQAFLFHQVRKYLWRLTQYQRSSTGFWRPSVLIVDTKGVTNAEDISEREKAVHKFTNKIKKGGLLVLGTLVFGGYNRSTLSRLRRQQRMWMSYFQENKFKGICECTLADSVAAGVRTLILLSGLGPMRPNTLVLLWHGEKDTTAAHSNETWEDYAQIFHDAILSEMHALHLRNFHLFNEDLVRRYMREFGVSGRILGKKKDCMYVDVWAASLTQPMGNPPGCDDCVALSLNLMHTLRNQSFWGTFTVGRMHVIVERDDDVYAARQWWVRFAKVKRLNIASLHVR